MSISPNKLHEMSSSDISKLKKSNKEDLCGYILSLRTKIEELVSYQLIAKRVQMLERSHISSLQYQRRPSIEISGIPASFDTKLEETCIELLGDIGCGKIEPSEIHACHRLKNKNKTIIRFVNRKHADTALHNKKKLEKIDRKKYSLLPQDKGIFLNESLCRPMQFLAYKVRAALKAKKIDSYNLWKGKLSIKMANQNYNISHIDDLIELNLAEEDDRLSFIN